MKPSLTEDEKRRITKQAQRNAADMRAGKGEETMQYGVEVNGTVFGADNQTNVPHDAFLNGLIKFVESNGWQFGGGTVQVDEAGNKVDDLLEYPLKGQLTQQEIEHAYLSDTIAILMEDDSYRTVEGLRGLIGEVRDRLRKLYKHSVTREDLGME